MNKKKSARIILIVCAAAILLCAAFGLAVYRQRVRQQQEAQAQAEAAALAAQQEAERQAEAERAAAEAVAQAAAEQAAAEEAARQQAEAAAKEAAQQAKDGVEYGDCIGTVWVEGTEVNCDLYWGDTTSIFRVGAGCSADNGCVMPGENGTVFVGAHTDSWFVDLKSAEIGSIIHLDTIWGDFQYKITDTKVIYDTDVDQCRWGDTEPNCILYTCYPFGIQTPTNQRYLVYADPIETDENGVVPSSLPGLEEETPEASSTADPQQDVG